MDYSNNGLTIKGTATRDTYIQNTHLTLPNNYVAEITVVDFDETLTTCDLCFEDWFIARNISMCYTRKLSNSSTNLQANLPQYQKGTILKMVRTGTSIEVYYDNLLRFTSSNINSTHIQQFKTYNNRQITVKDFKIKEIVS